MAAMLKPGERVRIKDSPSIRPEYRGLAGKVIERVGLGAPGRPRYLSIRLDGVRERYVSLMPRFLDRI